AGLQPLDDIYKGRAYFSEVVYGAYPARAEKPTRRTVEDFDTAIFFDDNKSYTHVHDNVAEEQKLRVTLLPGIPQPRHDLVEVLMQPLDGRIFVVGTEGVSEVIKFN